MKKLLLSLCFLACLAASGQSRDEVAVLSNTRALQHAVFLTKDSVSLAGLFSEKLSYGHSGGKVESREEALTNIIRNPSTYSGFEMSGISVWIGGPTAITRHIMTATEQTKEGKQNPLKLHIMLVWNKEKGKWKLMGRQAVKVM